MLRGRLRVLVLIHMASWATSKRFEAIGVASVLGIVACLAFEPYACEADEQCVRGGEGSCGPAGYCAYPSSSCPNGLRYEDNAGDGLGGQCVIAQVAEGSTSDGPDSSTEGEDTSTGDTTDTGSRDPSTTTEGDGNNDDDDNGGDRGSSEGGPSSDAESSGGFVPGECGGPGEPCCDDNDCDLGLSCFDDRCGCVETIATGQRHSCAIKVNGTVWCWGDNASGQLGPSDNPTEPTPIPLGSTFTSTAQAEALITSTHTCALRQGGTVFCWGDNASGQSNPGSLETTISPTQVVTESMPIAVAVGSGFSCIAREDDVTVTCFGANDAGQLTGTIDLAPGPVDAVVPDVEFTTIVAGSAHVCATTAQGDLYCWGSNASGQLGQDPVTVSSVATPTLVAPGVTHLAAGEQHTCFIDATGLHCVGANGQGQLGHGSTAPSFDITLVTELPATVTPTQLVAAANHTCALGEPDELFCWGSNDNGQLRLPPDDEGNDAFRLSPQAIDLGSLRIAQLSTGPSSSCARSTRGVAFCWGRNSAGEVGDGSTAYAFDPTRVELSCP